MSKEKQLVSVFEELREALFECNQSKLIELVSDEYQGFSLNGTIENKEIVLQTYKPGSIKVSVLPNPSFSSAGELVDLAYAKNPKTQPV